MKAMSSDIRRREFLVASVMGLGGIAPVRGQGVPASAFRALEPDEGELVYVGRARDPVRIKLSPTPQGRFAMITQDVAPGSVIPVHLHEKEDEIIFIQSGEGAARVGDGRVALRGGSTLYVPQGTWHGGENTGTAILKWVAIYSPSGFEGYFRAIGTTAPGDSPPRRAPAEREALDRRFGIRYPD